MAPAYFLVFFLLPHLLLPLSAAENQQSDNSKNCPAYYCGDPKDSEEYNYTEFGWLTVDNCIEPVQKIQLEMGGQLYDIASISPADTINLTEPWYSEVCKCQSPENLYSSTSPSITFRTTSKQTQLKCNHSTHTLNYFGYSISSPDCEMSHHETPSSQCLKSHPPINLTRIDDRLFSLSAAGIIFRVRVPGPCDACYFKGDDYKGGMCYQDDNGTMHCTNEDKGSKMSRLKLALVIPGVAGILIICVLIFLCRKKWKSASSNLVSRNISSVPSSKSDLERGSVYFGVLPIFSYSELEEATNNFDSNEELGDGGFGTVYYGKLRDGREVAVKRLYENNCKRVEQFMNEVQILAVLRHKNLVSLYGCTSRHSRELLLVYEFIPNGTVADHLHGDQPNPGSLTWPIRMSIAIETATALAYLHASDIIHRDVKTNNILLDNNFCVKVADFGLSRLFPMDVTHVSTAPQGTPGYLDPDYHQCYQLTDKSDVYSFGVVLIELISSLPAVDISRHRHEINLADLAISKIQNCAFSELIDSSLGFERDLVVRRMTTRVAELAFRCLQHDKDMRPSMDEVCDILKGIESENCEVEETEEVENIDVGVLEKSTKSLPSPDSDDVGLLKNMQLPHSPNIVTEKWVSRSTTPNPSA